LARGISVIIYDSLIYNQNQQKILSEIESKKKNGAICQFIFGDIRDIDLLKKSLEGFKPDFLFHFAELVGIQICDDNPKYTKKINFKASKVVISLAEELHIPIIYNSTSSVYGNQKERVALNEDAPLPEPTDNYCKHKLMIEKYIQDKKKMNPGFKIIMLRLATVCGLSPRMRLELMPNHFTYCAIAKGLIKISELEAFRAQVDIADIVDAYFTIIEKDNWPKLLYNVGHHNLQKIEVAKIIQSIMGCKIEPVGNLGDIRNLQIDSSAFYKDFNWQPKISFESTIKTTGKWIKNNLNQIEDSKFMGIINSPLDRWLGMI
jgi:nucleoside-diphosphate-sugar epimerase